jgi:hypothetical protein
VLTSRCSSTAATGYDTTRRWLPPLPLDEKQAHTMAKLLTIVGSKWNTTSNPCGWSGVTCRASHSSPSSVVKSITLSNHGISNRSIFDSICFLNTLQILDLSGNPLKGLRGEIPPPPWPFKEELRFPNLSGNQLARPISDGWRFLICPQIILLVDI